LNFHPRQDQPQIEIKPVPVEIQNEVRGDFELWAEACVRIRDRDGEGLIPFRLRDVQRRIVRNWETLFAAKGRVRMLVPKSRQQGISTLAVVYLMWRTMYTSNYHANITAHIASTTATLFQTAKDVYEHMETAMLSGGLPPGFVPEIKKSNARELSFIGTQSYMTITTAGSKQAGRGTSLNALHLSEAAMFENAGELVASLVSAVSGLNDTFICQESTGMPFGPFKSLVLNSVKDGTQSEWQVMFLSVLQDPAARRPLPQPGDHNYPFRPSDSFRELQSRYGLDDEQLYFLYLANYTIATADSADPETMQPRTFREYPIELEHCFIADNQHGFFAPQDVLAARAAKHYPEYQAVTVIGCDVGGEKGSSDKTFIVDRRGTVAGSQVNQALTGPYDQQAMHIANVVRQVGAQYLMVDYTNNRAFVTLLKQVISPSCSIIPVHFGEKPNFSELHANKRAELHDLLRLWLAAPRLWGDPQVSIPDDETLNEQLSAYQWGRGQCKRSHKGVLTMTDKEWISAECLEGSSPDQLDALILTFGVPDHMISELLSRQLEMMRLQREGLVDEQPGT